MSYTNGFQTLVQSMNGLLTFNDGAGTVIENGTITTQSLSLNNILATITNTSVSLWSNFTTGTANLLTGLTSGTINLGNSTVSIIIGAFTFVGKTIDTGSLSTNLSLFPTYNGAVTDVFTGFLVGTVNICTAMTSGTFNIGRGGNINLGSALTGMIIKIDGNGLDNKVFISTQSGASGTVKIGTNENSNQIGAVFVNNNVISASSGTTILRDIQRLAYETVSRLNPASYTVQANFISASQMNVTADFICGGTTLRNFDVRQSVETNGAQVGDGRGTLTTTCRTNEFLFNGGTIVPQPNPLINAVEIGYTNTQDDAVFINAGGPFGGVSIGGCGQSNPTYTTAYQRAMTVYPHYGTRLYTGGLSFDKGNLISTFDRDRGFFIATGQTTRTAALAGGAQVSINMIGMEFNSSPVITLGPISSPTSGITQYLVYTVYAISATTFNVYIRNPTTVSTVVGQVYGFGWTAIGGY